MYLPENTPKAKCQSLLLTMLEAVFFIVGILLLAWGSIVWGHNDILHLRDSTPAMTAGIGFILAFISGMTFVTNPYQN